MNKYFFTYGQLLEEVELKNNGNPQSRHIANLFDRLTSRDLAESKHYILYGKRKFEISNSDPKTFICNF